MGDLAFPVLRVLWALGDTWGSRLVRSRVRLKLCMMMVRDHREEIPMSDVGDA